MCYDKFTITSTLGTYLEYVWNIPHIFQLYYKFDTSAMSYLEWYIPHIFQLNSFQLDFSWKFPTEFQLKSK